MAEKLTYEELLAQLSYYKNHADWAEKKLLNAEEKAQNLVVEINKLNGEVKDLSCINTELSSENKSLSDRYNWLLE